MAAVGDVLFANTASCLASISSDRTVIIRKLARGNGDKFAFLPTRVITLKSTPTHFAFSPTESSTIVVSTMDRHVHRYDYGSGKLLSSFKPADPSTGDAVLVGSFALQRGGNDSGGKGILLGASSADRGLRMHDLGSGRLLHLEQGQSNTSSVCLLDTSTEQQGDEHLLINCSLDGLVFFWNVRQARTDEDSENSMDSSTKVPLTTSTLRKTLTKAEITKFQKSMDEDIGMNTPIRSPSPSRLREKTPRQSLLDFRKTSLAPNTNVDRSSGPSVSVDSSREQSPTTLFAKQARPGPKTRRPSLDPRRRSKSAANLNDLNDVAEQLCQHMRAFRERLESSVGKLDERVSRNLENEMKPLLVAVSEKTGRDPSSLQHPPNEPLDKYLARMIDERLALKEKSNPCQSKPATSDQGSMHDQPHFDVSVDRQSRRLETLTET